MVPLPDLVHSHDTAGSSGTGITSLERIGVTSLSEIISSVVDNDGSANDGLGAKEGNVLVWQSASSLRVCVFFHFAPRSQPQKRSGQVGPTSQVDADVSGSISLDVSYTVKFHSLGLEEDGRSPRSPTCLSAESGPPWFLPLGLKWPPAEVHPLLSVSLSCLQGST